MAKRIKAIAERMYVGITGQSTETCEWYKGIALDAATEYRKERERQERDSNNGGE